MNKDTKESIPNVIQKSVLDNAGAAQNRFLNHVRYVKKIGIAFLLIASTGVFIAYLNYRADFMALEDLASKERDDWKKMEHNKDGIEIKK